MKATELITLIKDSLSQVHPEWFTEESYRCTEDDETFREGEEYRFSPVEFGEYVGWRGATVRMLRRGRDKYGRYGYSVAGMMFLGTPEASLVRVQVLLDSFKTHMDTYFEKVGN